MSSLTQEQKKECEKLFKFLDKDNDQQLTGREVVIGLGVLGKTCTITEQNKIKNDYTNCDLEKPGFISQKDFIFVLKRFFENITDKDINDITKEVGVGDDGYINLEGLAKEMLLK